MRTRFQILRSGAYCLLLALCAELLTSCHVRSISPATNSKAAIPPIRNTRGGFFLQPGDRVVFYGDSITDQQKYTNYLETFCLTRYPNIDIRFINSGCNGDNVHRAGCGRSVDRLSLDVLAYQPTVVTMMFGMNDGSYSPFQRRRFEYFRDGYRELIAGIREQNPAPQIVAICATPYDDINRPPMFPGGYDSVLSKYNAEMQRLAKEEHFVAIDAHTPVLAALKKSHQVDPKRALRLLPDRVHPSNGGHLLLAGVILKSWNADATVSEVTLDAAANSTISAVGAQISDLKLTSKGGAFNQLDHCLPWPFPDDPDTRFVRSITNLTNRLNRFRLTVRRLKPGRYGLWSGGKKLGRWSADELSHGIDLTTLPLHPANRQARELLQLTNLRNRLHFRTWRVDQPISVRLQDSSEAGRRRAADLNRQVEVIRMRQRELAVTHPYLIELRPE